MRSISEHQERIARATELYVAANVERDNVLIEAARDGLTVVQLAEPARLPPAAVARIIGEEWSDTDG